MSELIEFLLARIAEDEAVAKRAASFSYDHPLDAPWERAKLSVKAGAAFTSDHFFARHDPARVLAECEAKRRIVERLHLAGSLAPGWSDLILRSIALPYVDHEDYREEWTP